MLGLTLLAGGVFLFFNQSSDVNAIPTFTQVFADDFNRANGPVGNGWESTDASWAIVNNAARGQHLAAPLLRPTTENIQNGKVTIDAIQQTANAYYNYAVARYGDYGGTVAFYIGLVAQTNTGGTNSSCAIGRFVDVNQDGIFQVSEQTYNISTNCAGVFTGDFSFDFIVESTSPFATDLTLEVRDGVGNVRSTVTVTDTTPMLQNVAGQWGIMSYGITNTDNFTLYDADASATGTELSLTSSHGQNVKLGTTITYTLSDDEAQTVTLSDGGAGGTFSTTSVELNAGNSYSATFTYTPNDPGMAMITATPTIGNPVEAEVFVSPFALTIGFIGDSITAGVANNGSGNISASPNATAVTVAVLGTGFSNNNRGVSATTTSNWANDNYSGTPIMTNAINALTTAGVEIVSIMLGTNDGWVQPDGTFGDPGTSPAQYKANLQQIITTLKAAGIKKIILNEPPFLDRNTGNYLNADLRISVYGNVLDELANGRDVLRGSTVTYDFFKNNTSLMGDGAHPTTPAGHEALGEQWAGAYQALLMEPYNDPDHAFSTSTEYTIGSGASLTHTSAVDFRAFAHYVTVDGVELGEGVDYLAESGSTKVVLTSGFLDTLAVGDHALNVYFLGTGGVGTVRLADIFKITSGAELPGTGVHTVGADGITMIVPYVAATIVVVFGVTLYLVKRRCS